MLKDLFDLTDRVAIVTGGYGVLGGYMADALISAGARVAVLGRSREATSEKASDLRRTGGDAIGLVADVLDEDGLVGARDEILNKWGRIDILVNAAGGNVARARTDDRPVFDLQFDAFDEVVRLNLHGSVYPTLIFGKAMVDNKKGSIVNVSSIAATRALSGVLGYSAAKAGIENLTRWMATDLALRYGDGIRVNAIAPGFFVAKQNRDVLLNSDGTYTDRARSIIAGTPMRRFGRPEELQGPVLWLCSDASSFVTGSVIQVDGGFAAFSGL